METVDKSLLMMVLIMVAIWLIMNEFYGDKKYIRPFAQKVMVLIFEEGDKK